MSTESNSITPRPHNCKKTRRIGNLVRRIYIRINGAGQQPIAVFAAVLYLDPNRLYPALTKVNAKQPLGLAPGLRGRLTHQIVTSGAFSFCFFLGGGEFASPLFI